MSPPKEVDPDEVRLRQKAYIKYRRESLQFHSLSPHVEANFHPFVPDGEGAGCNFTQGDKLTDEEQNELAAAALLLDEKDRELEREMRHTAFWHVPLEEVFFPFCSVEVTKAWEKRPHPQDLPRCPKCGGPPHRLSECRL